VVVQDNNLNPGTTVVATSWKFPWFATLRGRVGWLADPTLLLYGTGGLAVAEAKFAVASSITCQRFGPGSTGTIPQASPCLPPAGAPIAGTTAFSDNATRVGFAVGGGVEKKFNKNWSAKAEYLYLDFGTHSFVTGTAAFSSFFRRSEKSFSLSMGSSVTRLKNSSTAS
jgi:outer membrane immunogenic protein